MICAGCKTTLSILRSTKRKIKGLCLSCNHRAEKNLDFKVKYLSTAWLDEKVVSEQKEEQKEKQSSDALSKWFNN